MKAAKAFLLILAAATPRRRAGVGVSVRAVREIARITGRWKLNGNRSQEMKKRKLGTSGGKMNAEDCSLLRLRRS